MTSPPRKKVKLSMEDFLSPLIVMVGADEKKFFVTEELLCSVSEFFKAACRPEWNGGVDHIVTLKEEDPAIFLIFLSWLITNDIHSAQDLIKYPTKDEEGDEDSTIKELLCRIGRQLIKCFVFADYIQCHQFQNVIMGLIIKLLKRDSATNRKSDLGITSRTNVQIIYGKTSQTSPLRRLILDLVIDHLSMKVMSAHIYNHLENNHEFIHDLLLRNIEMSRLERKKALRAWEKCGCEYHSHPDQPEGYKCTMEKFA